jgi:Zn-dependent oligopeptidase
MAKHYMPAFIKGMADGREEIKNLSNSKSTPTFQNTIEALDRSGEILNKVSFVFFSLATANTNDSLQKIEVEVSPLLSAYRDEILLDSALFKRVKSLHDSKEKLSLTPEQEFLLENLYKNFVRNGALLKGADRDTLKKLNERLSVLSVKFS